MKKKVVYVAGLGHSGSTLLNLILGEHSKMVGLGEVDSLLGGGMDFTIEAERMCSCGNTAIDCPFWHKVAAGFKANSNLSRDEQYLKVFEIAAESFGEDTVMIDHSKGIDALKRLIKIPEIDVKVIFLIKDVRSYTISRIDRANRIKARRKEKDTAVLRSKDSFNFPSYHFLRWYQLNKKMLSFLKQKNVSYLQIGYEELCLYPEIMLEKLCEFIGVAVEPSMLNFQNSSSHILRGNKMRHNPEKQKIRYDNRWFFRNEWIRSAFLLPQIIHFNKKEIYKNTHGKIWNK